MSVTRIKKGKDIKLKGVAEKKIVEAALPKRVAVQPQDFRGIKSRLLIKVGDEVKVGTPLLEDKANSEIRLVAPASGKIAAINRGDKRALLEVVIDTDGQQESVQLRQFAVDELDKSSRDDIIKHLLEGGVWPCIRHRPFSKVANPEEHPKSIFIQAMNTEPLALDVDYVLNDREEEFQIGLNIIKKLTEGEVHVCCAENAQSKALTQAQNVQIHQFAGPHPTGNVSTHIHYIDPIHKGEIVWYLRAEDVLRVAHLFLKGTFSPERFVAVTGEGTDARVYRKTVIGVPISHLVQGESPFGERCISGSVLTGTNVGPEGYVCFYDSQVTIIPEGGKRELLGWMVPGFNKYTFTKTYASAFVGKGREVSLNTDKNGDDRAIVLNHIYDDYVTIDIMTYFLLRAVIAGDIEEAEKLGILECDEEDFALCTFACPSKTDVGGIIRDGLELIEKEG